MSTSFVHTSRLLAASVAFATAICASPALAADTAAEEAVDQPQVEEIVVTAQRVETNLQKTPISITAFSDKTLTRLNVHDVLDLRGLVPNLEILPQAGGGAGVFGRNQASVAIRGVGSAQRFFNQDTKVGVYVDDVYLSSTYSMNLGFFDIADVQVLKGPQGTLFGKNTIGGALLIRSKLPEKEFGGYGRLAYGTFNRIDAQGAVNIPLGDTLAARVSFYSFDQDGYIKHLLDSRKSNDAHEKAIRGQLRWTPTDRLTVDLKGEYGQSHDNGNVFIIRQINPNAGYVRNYNSVNAVPYQVQYAPLGLPFTVYGDNVSKFTYSPRPYGSFTPFSKGRTNGVQLRAAYELADGVTLKSITGYKKVSLDSYRGDGTPGGLYTEYNEFRVKQYSQELQLLGSFFDDRLKVVAGGFYIKQDALSEQITGPDYVDPVGYYYANDNDFPSWAAYIQGSVKITDKLTATAGVRYTIDEKNTRSIIWTSGCSGTFLTGYRNGTGGCWVPGPDGNTWSPASKTWKHTDPRVQLDYQWTPSLMTYLSLTSGYQSGGFNTQGGPGIPANIPYEQEIVWNYEAGVKSEWFDRRLRINAAVFHQKYHNYQSSILVFYNGVDTRTTSSAADAHNDGVEIEIDARPFEALGLHASYAYLDQGYDKIFPGAQGITLATAISSAPKNEYSLSADYTVPIGEGRVVAAVDWRWVGRKPSGTAPAISYTPPYGLLGGNVTYTAPSGRWNLSVWAKNLLDKYYYTAFSDRLNTGIGLTSVTPGMPRQVGVGLGFNF